MSRETFSRIAKYFHLTEGVDLTGGGEPIRNPYLLEMVSAAKSAGCEVGFSTNGVRLTADLSQSLTSLGIDWISFSVDAASAERYESIRRGARFQTVLDNIAALRDFKARRGGDLPRLMLVFVMMGAEGEVKQNYHELPAMVELAYELGVEQVVAKNLDVILKDEDDRRRLFSHQGEDVSSVRQARNEAEARARELGVKLRLYELQPRERPVCEHNPLKTLFINWEGRVSPCITLSYAEERLFNGEKIQTPCQHFGNIHDAELPEIWERPDYTRFRGAFDARRSWQRSTLLDAASSWMLGGESDQPAEIPPAPEGCRTCYYLYGI